jgi:hypothetical protein
MENECNFSPKVMRPSNFRRRVRSSAAWAGSTRDRVITFTNNPCRGDTIPPAIHHSVREKSSICRRASGRSSLNAGFHAVAAVLERRRIVQHLKSSISILAL